MLSSIKSRQTIRFLICFLLAFGTLNFFGGMISSHISIWNALSAGPDDPKTKCDPEPDDDDDDGDDCEDDGGGGGGGGSGGGGGGGGTMCPPPKDDIGHTVLIDRFSCVENPPRVKHVMFPLVKNEGDSFYQEQYFPVTYVVPEYTVRWMDPVCCVYPDGSLADIFGLFTMEHFAGNANAVSIKWHPGYHWFVEHSDFVPFPGDYDINFGKDPGCITETIPDNDFGVFKFDPVEVGSVTYLLELDPYPRILCDEWDGKPETDRTEIILDVYKFRSFCETPGFDISQKVPLVYFDMGDGVNINQKTITITFEVEAPEQAPMGDLIVDLGGSDSLLDIRTPGGEVIGHGSVIPAQPSQSFVISPKDHEGEFRPSHLNVYHKLPQDLSQTLYYSDQSEDSACGLDYNALKSFVFRVEKVKPRIFPFNEKSLSADDGSPGWAEEPHGIAFVREYPHIILELDDGTEVDWNIKSGSGQLSQNTSISQDSFVGTSSKIPPITDQSQEIEAHIKTMVFQYLDTNGNLVDMSAPTDITVAFPEITVEPGQGDNVSISYGGVTESAPAPSYPGDGASLIDIEIEVRDQYGNLAKDGTPVNSRVLASGEQSHIDRENDPDWRENSVMLTENGKVSTQIQSNLYWEDQPIEVWVEAGLAASETVMVNEVFCNLSASETELDSSQGQRAVVTAQFFDSEGNPVVDDTPVVPYCSHGSIFRVEDDRLFDFFTERLLTKDGQVEFVYDSTGAAIRSGNDVAIGCALNNAYDVLRMPITHTNPDDLHLRIVDAPQKNQMTLSLSDTTYSEETFCVDEDGEWCDTYAKHVATKMEVVGRPHEVITLSHFLPSKSLWHRFSTIEGSNILPEEQRRHDALMFGGDLDYDNFSPESGPASLHLGEDDHIEIPAHNDLNLKGTIKLWAMLESEESEGQDYAGTLLDLPGAYLLEVNSEGYVEFTVYTDQGATTVTSLRALSPDMWSEVMCGVRAGVQYLKVDSDEQNLEITGDLLISDDPLRIGEGYAGFLDELMITTVTEVFGDSDYLSILGVDQESKLMLDANGIGPFEVLSNGFWQPNLDLAVMPFSVKASRPDDPGGPEDDDSDKVWDYVLADYYAFMRTFYAVSQTYISAVVFSAKMMRDWAVKDIIYYDGQCWQRTQQFRNDPLNTLRGKEQELTLLGLEMFTSFGAVMDIGGLAIAAIGPEAVSVWRAVSGMASGLELLTKVFGGVIGLALFPYFSSIRKLVNIFGKIPAEYSVILGKVVLSWLQQLWRILKGIRSGNVNPHGLQAHALGKAPFLAALSRKAEELPANQLELLSELLASSEEMVRRHADLARGVTSENLYKYDEVLDTLLKVRIDKIFESHYVPQWEIADTCTRVVSNLKPGFLGHTSGIYGEMTELVPETIAWMVAKSSASQVEELKFFYKSVDDVLSYDELAGLHDSLRKLLRDNPLDKVTGIEEILGYLIKDGVPKAHKDSMLKGLELGADVVGENLTAVTDVKISIVTGGDIPLFRGSWYDFYPLSTLADFENTFGARHLGAPEALLSLNHFAASRIDSHVPFKFFLESADDLDDFRNMLINSGVDGSVIDELLNKFDHLP